MTIKTTTLVILCYLFTFTLGAQLDSFDFDNFKVPDIQRKTLVLYPDFNLYNTSYAGVNSRTAERGSDLRIRTTFTGNKTTRKTQKNTYLSGQLGYDLSNENLMRNQNGLYLSLDLVQNQNFFFKPKRYLKLDYSLDFEYDPNSFISRIDRERKEIFTYLNLTPRLGFGRIENVSDLWHGYSILKNLEEQNLLKGSYNEKELIAFGEEISRIKNTRRLDFRMENIAEREQLLAYMIENGFADPKNYRFYPIVSDAWNYELFQTRSHGQVIEVGLVGGRNTADRDSDTELARRFLEYGPIIEFARHQAKSLSWQFNQTYTLSYNFQKSHSYLGFESDDELLFFNAQFLIGYFLNQRTNLQVSPNVSLQDYKNSLGTIYSASISGEFNYFISPLIRYSIEGRVSYYHNATSTNQFQHRNQNQLLMSLNYYIY